MLLSRYTGGGYNFSRAHLEFYGLPMLFLSFAGPAEDAAAVIPQSIAPRAQFDSDAGQRS
jgi:hypothetical protein